MKVKRTSKKSTKEEFAIEISTRWGSITLTIPDMLWMIMGGFGFIFFLIITFPYGIIMILSMTFFLWLIFYIWGKRKGYR